jgi:hypothetical protein
VCRIYFDLKLQAFERIVRRPDQTCVQTAMFRLVAHPLEAALHHSK